MAKNKKVKSKLKFNMEYEYSPFSEKMYDINRTIDKNVENYLNKVLASHFSNRQLGKESIMNYALSNSHQTALLMSMQVAKESRICLKERNQHCLSVYLEKDLFKYRYIKHLKEQNFEKVPQVIGEFQLTLGMKDLGNPELEDENINKVYEITQTFSNVPLEYKLGNSYLPTSKVIERLYYGIILNRIQTKKSIDYSKCLEISKELSAIDDGRNSENVEDGFIEISSEGFTDIKYKEELESHTITNIEQTSGIKVVNKLSNRISLLPVFSIDFDGIKKQVISFKSARDIVFNVNSENPVQITL